MPSFPFLGKCEGEDYWYKLDPSVLTLPHGIYQVVWTKL